MWCNHEGIIIICYALLARAHTHSHTRTHTHTHAHTHARTWCTKLIHHIHSLHIFVHRKYYTSTHITDNMDAYAIPSSLLVHLESVYQRLQLVAVLNVNRYWHYIQCVKFMNVLSLYMLHSPNKIHLNACVYVSSSQLIPMLHYLDWKFDRISENLYLLGTSKLSLIFFYWYFCY